MVHQPRGRDILSFLNNLSSILFILLVSDCKFMVYAILLIDPSYKYILDEGIGHCKNMLYSYFEHTKELIRYNALISRGSVEI
jgi:hypothetical protein